MDRKKFWAFLVVFAVWGTLFLLAAKFYFKKFGFFLPEWRVGDFVYFIVFVICFFLFHLGSLVKHQIFGKIVLTGFSFFFVPFFLALYPYKLNYMGSVVFSVTIPILLAVIPDFIDFLKKEKEDKDNSINLAEQNMPYAAIGAISAYMFWVPLANGAIWLWKAEFGIGLIVSLLVIVILFALLLGMQKLISVFIAFHKWIFTAPSD
jgi:hypothetical protein